MLLHPANNPGEGPPKAERNLDRHHAVGNFAEHMRRGKTRQLVAFNTFQQVRARSTILYISREVIKKRIGIKKHRGTEGEIFQGHGPCSRSSSGSVIRRRHVAVSAV